MKLSELYPQLSVQLKDGYQKLWDYLTMEEFRRIVDELRKEANDVDKYAELTQDAIVR